MSSPNRVQHFLKRRPAARIGRGKPPAIVAAIRVPERAQLRLARPRSPQIFVHEGARQSLERRLMAAHAGTALLSITDNRHSIVTHRRVGGVLRVRVHHMFLDAPAAVVDALVRYVVHGDRDASVVVGRFIEDSAHRLAPRSRSAKLLTRGEHHDLLRIVTDLDRRYFGGSVGLLVTWGKRGGARRARPRATIRLGSYSAGERLVRVHPSLDRAWVPRYFVEYVVFHEMLHHVVPGVRRGARTMLHPEEFLARERTFRHFHRAIAWERAHIARLLRS